MNATQVKVKSLLLLCATVVLSGCLVQSQKQPGALGPAAQTQSPPTDQPGSDTSGGQDKPQEPVITTTTPGAYGDVPSNNAIETVSVVDEFQSGDSSLLVRFQDAAADKNLYVLNRTASNGTITANQVGGSNNFSIFTGNPIGSNELRMWGQNLKIEEVSGKNCLVSNNNPTKCVATVLGRQLPEDIQTSEFFGGAVSEVEQEYNDAMNDEVVPDEMAQCGISKRDRKIRRLSMLLSYGVELLTVVNSGADYQKLMALYMRAVQEIIEAMREPRDENQGKCPDSWDYQTASYAMKGLSDFFKKSERTQVRDALISMWKRIIRDNIYNTFLSGAASGQNPLSPLATAQALSMALVANQMGAKDAFTKVLFTDLLGKLFQTQSVTSQQKQCQSQSPQFGQGLFQLGFGGWKMDETTCAQSMHIQSQIMTILLELFKFIVKNQICINPGGFEGFVWTIACEHTKVALLNGLTFFSQAQVPQSQGLLFNFLPSSVPQQLLIPGLGTGMGHAALLNALTTLQPFHLPEILTGGFGTQPIKIKELRRNARDAIRTLLGRQTRANQDQSIHSRKQLWMAAGPFAVDYANLLNMSSGN